MKKTCPKMPNFKIILKNKMPTLKRLMNLNYQKRRLNLFMNWIKRNVEQQWDWQLESPNPCFGSNENVM
ncbi:hypothetical protein DEO72_LG6g3418 [Vigna unguiculata]|uniref:Uncharacterized protein n=1 Tax=Vigna unguiculata TaxID=3917 RepID=A0A4D6MF74_VIGUN|nr:hypothetical protein DEO72_LG6g3418 [Vigna unguiculata]